MVAYPALAGLALLGGLASGRPELTILALPFLLAILVGALAAAPRVIRVSAALVKSRLMEGEEAVIELTLGAIDPRSTLHPDPPPQGREKLEVTLDLEPGLAMSGDRIIVTTLTPGRPVSLRLPVRCLRWGRYDAGHLRFRRRDPLWLFTQEGALELPLPLRVYPRPQTLRALVRPADTQVYAGNQVARARGDGIEFSEIRAFVPGDRVRHVNWRATGRRNALQVNELRPERNSDVILFLDTFGTYGPSGERSIDRTLRAAIGLADRYLQQRDRVGVIAFGGLLRWLTPGTGMRQRYQLVESILDTRVEVSYAWKRLETIPSRTLPPRAMILALTPLLDERILAALDQLVGRGFDLAICEVEVPPAVDSNDPIDRLAARVFALRRDSVRARYHRAGVATVAWSPGRPLGPVIEEVRTFRRSGRRRPA